MPSAAQAEHLRAVQAELSRSARRDLEAFFATLSLTRPEAVRDALLEFFPLLVERYGDEAAVYAAEWYDEVRAAEGVRGRFRARPAATISDERAIARVRSAAGHLFTDTPAETLPALLGSLTKYVLEPGRATVLSSTRRDPQAVGWQRIARPGACDFCRMLAGRGAVYKEQAALFAAHPGRCYCAAAPSWDPQAPEVDVRAYEASKRTSNLTPEQKAARNEMVRDWIASNLN